MAAPVGGQIFSEVLPYLEVTQGNTDEVEEKVEKVVPNVIDMTLNEATKTLEQEGFTVRINNESEEMNKDEIKVNSQIPAQGITAYQGSCVYLN